MDYRSLPAENASWVDVDRRACAPARMIWIKAGDGLSMLTPFRRRSAGWRLWPCRIGTLTARLFEQDGVAHRDQVL